MKLPEEFKKRMLIQLGKGYKDFLESYDKPPCKGLRVNTLKISAEDFEKLSPFSVKKSALLSEGYILAEDLPYGAHPYHFAGLYYLQDPSAMEVIDAVEAGPDMRVLDMCAAPGGKATGIAARMKGRGLLVLNEAIKSRADALISNVQRLGITNCVVVSSAPSAVANALTGYFDRVLVDAPCSGEGMFRKDASAVIHWSPEHVRACALRQKNILDSAASALKKGGILVYSTCTFSEEENEDVVKGFLEEHKDFELIGMKKTYPHNSQGEGHFIAKMVRESETETIIKRPLRLKKCSDKAVNDFFDREYIGGGKDGLYYTGGDRIALVDEMPPEEISKLYILGVGVSAGKIKGGRFEPDHALYMACRGEFVKRICLAPDSIELYDYLAGKTVTYSGEEKGYCQVCADKYAIGFGKLSDGVIKNHIPKSCRLINGDTIDFFRHGH